MSWQKIELNMIPDTKLLPVVHASQFDSNRSISFQMFTGEDEWTIPEGLTIELHCRKVDDNIVTLAPFSVVGSVITFITTEQLTACSGQNKCELSFIDADDLVIGSLNFILDVEPDPLKGGLTSASSIYNLTQQIEDITQEVIGEDYYNKTQTDALLANKADKSELPDMTNYYTKTQTDNLLNNKADRTDLARLVSKAELEHAIEEEDRTLKDWAFTQFATYPGIAQRYYNKNQVDALLDDIFPTLTASGAVASFITALNKPFVSITADAAATTITRCGVNLFDDTCLRSYTDEITLPAGTYYFKGFISTTGTDQQNTRFYWLDDTNTWQIITSSGSFDNGAITWTGSAFGWESGTFYATVTLTKTETFRMSCSNTTANTRRVGIFLTNADTFTPYNGQTVPVADATTLTTLSGINNVFADSGNVTVQYKYMSM